MWSQPSEVMTDSSANCSVEIESAAHSANISSNEISVAVEINEPSTPPVAREEAYSSGNAVNNIPSEGTSSIPTVPVVSTSTATHSTTNARVGDVEAGIPDPSGSTPEAGRHSSPRVSEQPTTSEMSGNPGDHVHSRSNSRRQRNGLFGINIDLNFDPSWLVPSNVAGRSISSLSMLPDWARPPVNITIPNREPPAPPESRQSQHHHHHHHHASSSGILGTIGGSGGGTSRLTPHSSPPNENWNSSFASSSHSSTSTPNIQHHHGLSRTRHMLTSMRSVDEDLDADYNPVSTIDLGAGRDRSSNSYVIDMDSPMGGWAEDEGAAGAHGEHGDDASHPDNSNVTTALLGGAGETNGGGGRRSASDMSLPTADGNAPSMADAATGANERTRAAEILRDAPETRAFINEISRYTTIRPFIVINFLKGVFDHGTSILAFLALVVTFSHANSMVKKEVSKQRKRNLLYLSMIVINLAACVAFIYYIFNEMELYYALVFMPTGSDLSSFWSLMWAVGVTDYVAKFGTVLVKIFVVALPGCILPFQKRGKYYLFIEHSSQLYRSFLPVYPWMFYLVSAYEGSARMFGLFLAGLYVFFKISDSIGRIKEWLKALEKLLSNVHYGTNPTTKQLDSAGTICPICHDNYASPTRLACSHIFCEECVATWFDRERTCPMCRAKVVDDPTYRDGSTSQYIQLF